jgi:hypothetical protein
MLVGLRFGRADVVACTTRSDAVDDIAGQGIQGRAVDPTYDCRGVDALAAVQAEAIAASQAKQTLAPRMIRVRSVDMLPGAVTDPGGHDWARRYYLTGIEVLCDALPQSVQDGMQACGGNYERLLRMWADGELVAPGRQHVVVVFVLNALVNEAHQPTDAYT